MLLRRILRLYLFHLDQRARFPGNKFFPLLTVVQRLRIWFQYALNFGEKLSGLSGQLAGAGCPWREASVARGSKAVGAGRTGRMLVARSARYGKRFYAKLGSIKAGSPMDKSTSPCFPLRGGTLRSIPFGSPFLGCWRLGYSGSGNLSGEAMFGHCLSGEPIRSPGLSSQVYLSRPSGLSGPWFRIIPIEGPGPSGGWPWLLIWVDACCQEKRTQGIPGLRTK